MFLIIYFVLGSDSAKFATGDWTAEEAAQFNVRSTKENNQTGENDWFKTEMSIYFFLDKNKIKWKIKSRSLALNLTMYIMILDFLISNSLSFPFKET